MRVAIYCRLSDEDRDKSNPNDDSESIQNQKNMLIKYAIEQGWDIFDIYSDDDYAGSDRERPDFKRLLKDAEGRKFQIILCKTQSRFSRELEIVEKYIHGQFVEWGIRFVGLVDNADTDVKGNKKSRQINGLVNEWYLEDLSENVCSSLDNKRSEGQYIASFALYGYRKSEQDKNKILIDEDAAQVIRRIFQKYNEGHGLYSIARMLNDGEVPNPTTYKKDKGFKVMSKTRSQMSPHWSVNTVRSILGNRMYAGDMIQGKWEKVSYKSRKLRRVPSQKWFVVEGTHEPIIEGSLWAATQERLSRRTRMRKDGTIHAFAGRTFCSQCGLALRSSSSKGNRYLRCPKGDVARSLCDGCRIKYELLESRVLDELNDLTRRYYDESLLREHVTLKDVSENELRACMEELGKLTEKTEERDKARLALYLDKIKGAITEADFNSLNQLLLAESEKHEKKRVLLEQRVNQLEVKIRNCKSKAEVIDAYKHFDKMTRELAASFVERIEVGKRNPETHEIPVKIVWKI
jgi:site-specific DNA recombinase